MLILIVSLDESISSVAEQLKYMFWILSAEPLALILALQQVKQWSLVASFDAQDGFVYENMVLTPLYL